MPTPYNNGQNNGRNPYNPSNQNNGMRQPQQPNGYARQPQQNSNGYAQQPQRNPSAYAQQPQRNPSAYAQQPHQNPNGYAQQPHQNPNGYVQQPNNYGYAQQNPNGYAPRSNSNGYAQQPNNGAPNVNIYMNQPNRPNVQLKTDRNYLITFLLGMVTFGIYIIICNTQVVNDFNLLTNRHDGKNTMHYCLMCFLLTPVTCGIFYLVWMHQFSERIQRELARRGIAYDYGPSTFWLWGVLGCFIGVGPIICWFKLYEAVNLLSADYNRTGD